jgi:hypothetical protein
MDSNETFKWEQLASRQKIYIAAAAVLIIGIAIWAGVDKYQSWQSVRQYEQAATTAKREAADALLNAEKIAREKVEVEKKLAETEGKRDVKRKEEFEAKARSADARLEYNRALRERRGDNPTVAQLCAELAALGHPCE